MQTITITFPQVKINVSVDNITFDTLENAVFEVSQQIGRKAIEKALFDIDNILRQTRPKKILGNTGRREKYFLTRLGDIRYKRTRYEDASTGKSRYLLEEKLNIQKNQRISLARAKIEMLIASLSPYRHAQEYVELLTGCRRSHEAIRQSVIKEAKRIIAHQEQSIEKIKRLQVEEEEDLTSPGSIAYMETDSAFIRLQRRRKRKGKVYKIKIKRQRRKRRSIEVKLGIGYKDKVKRYKNGRCDSLRLKDKFMYAGIQNGRKFMENLSLIAEKKLSLSKTKAIIFGGDGGSYVLSGIKDYFTGAIYVLSRFHLKRNIKRTLSYRPKLQSKINSLINKDKINEALRLLNRILTRTKQRKRRKLLKELYTYIHHNREGINPIKRIEDKALKDQIKGSGAMESNVDKFLAHRFKKRGMSWSPKGALSLLKVKETIANNEWDIWWSKERDERIEINTEPLRQLTSKKLWISSKRNIPDLIEASIPALRGPEQSEPWVKVLRQLQTIDYYK